MKKFEKLSKRLSFLLRHHPEKYGIDLSPDESADLELMGRRLGVLRRNL